MNRKIHKNKYSNNETKLKWLKINSELSNQFTTPTSENILKQNRTKC